MTIIRTLVTALGLAGAAYGILQLLDLGWTNLVDAGVWLVGGVVIHDGILAPLTIVAGLLVTRLWRGGVPVPVVVGAIVLATVTVTAVPVLGRFGARPDNATLLDRNYLLGWLGIVAFTVVIVALSLRAASRRRGDAAEPETTTLAP